MMMILSVQMGDWEIRLWMEKSWQIDFWTY